MTVAALVAAALLILGPVRTTVGERFEQMKSEAVTQLERLLDRRITYASVSPSILRYLSVHDLTIHGTSDEPAELLTVQQLRIYYRPLRLIQGRYAEAFSEVRIENTSLTFDTRTRDALAGLIADAVGDGASTPRDLAPLLPDDFAISGRNIRLSIRSDLGQMQMERLFFTTSLADELITLRAQGELGVTDLPGSFPVSRLAGHIEAVGSINAANGDTLLELSFPEIASDLASIRGQVLQVRFSDGVLEARNVQSRDPIDLYVRYVHSDAELYARVLADGYRLSDLVLLHGAYAPYNEYLSLPFRGQATATVTPDTFSFGGSLLTEIHTMRDLPGGELTLRFDGDARGVTIDQLSYVTAAGTARYHGTIGFSPLRPTGELTVENLTYGGIRPLSMTATLHSSGDTVTVEAGRFTYAGSTFSALRGSITLDNHPTADLIVELESSGTSRLEIATEHREDGAIVRARVDARGVVPDRLAEIQRAVVPGLQVPDLSLMPAGIIVDTRVLVDATNGLEVDVPLFYAYDPRRPDDHISFSMTYENGFVEVRELLASYDGYRGRGDFVARVENGGSIRFSSDVVVQDVPYQFTGRFRPDNSLEIRGLHDVDARFFFGERDEIIFRASGDLPLPIIGGEDSRVAFSADGYFFNADDWSVNVKRLVASGIPYATVASSTVSLAGTFVPSGGRLSSVTYVDAFSALHGRGALSWDLAARTGRVDLDLGNTSGESYGIVASYADGTFEAAADVAALPLLRLGVETVRGSLTGSVIVKGPPEAMHGSARFELVDGKFNNDAIELAGEIEVSPGSVRIVNGSGRYARSRLESVDGSLALDDGALALAATLVQGTENGSITIGLAASGAFGALTEISDVEVADFSGSLRVSGIPVRDGQPAEWSFDVSRQDGTTHASGGPDGALAATIRSEGMFRAWVGAPMPLRFEAIGLIERGTIEADLTRVWGDAARLWAIVDSPGFGLTGGTATGSVRIVGPLSDPDFYGTLVAEGATAELEILPDVIGPARMFLVFDEKILTVREASVPAGPGRARVSVEATMDRWLPDQYRVSIATEDDRPVRVTHDFGGVMIDGLASGTIRVDGTLATTNVTGTVVGSAMTITLSEVPDDSLYEEPPNDLVVDLNVRAGRGVEFRWPTSTFPILRGFAGVGESLRIMHESAYQSYSVVGGVSIQGGEVFYFDRSFYIRDGRITFNENELEFDPLLTVNAEIREVADEGPVRIYLVADERPLSEFTPRWRSDPPLSEAAIIGLLGGSMFVGEGGAPIDFSDAVLLTSDVVSQFAIIRGFESSVRDVLQLDLFSIRTQLFQNLLRGVIDQNMHPLDNHMPSLGQYLDNTTLFMGKYLGTDLFMELLVQLRASPPLTTERTSLAGIEIESEFSLEWQTPFFLLEWSFFPRDPTSLFLADNTIRFSWEFSY